MTRSMAAREWQIPSLEAPELLECLRRIGARGVIDTTHGVKVASGQVFRYGIATGQCQRNPSSASSSGVASPGCRGRLWSESLRRQPVKTFVEALRAAKLVGLTRPPGEPRLRPSPCIGRHHVLFRVIRALPFARRPDRLHAGAERLWGRRRQHAGSPSAPATGGRTGLLDHRCQRPGRNGQSAELVHHGLGRHDGVQLPMGFRGRDIQHFTSTDEKLRRCRHLCLESDHHRRRR